MGRVNRFERDTTKARIQLYHLRAKVPLRPRAPMDAQHIPPGGRHHLLQGVR